MMYSARVPFGFNSRNHIDSGCDVLLPVRGVDEFLQALSVLDHPFRVFMSTSLGKCRKRFLPLMLMPQWFRWSRKGCEPFLLVCSMPPMRTIQRGNGGGKSVAHVSFCSPSNSILEQKKQFFVGIHKHCKCQCLLPHHFVTARRTAPYLGQ